MKSGILCACIGSSRSGKTQFVLSQVSGLDRVLIWDIKGEYRVQYRAQTKAQLAQLLVKLAGKPGVIGYTGNIQDFDFFCRVAQQWVLKHYTGGHESALVFEETADVTSPVKAPAQYGIILRRFLSYGVDIYAVTQRPAESDKTAIGNASVLHVCRLNLRPDRKSAANNTGLPLADIESLKADQKAGYFEFLHADTGRRVWQKGTLTFVRDKPIWKEVGAKQEL